MRNAILGVKWVVFLSTVGGVCVRRTAVLLPRLRLVAGMPEACPAPASWLILLCRGDQPWLSFDPTVLPPKTPQPEVHHMPPASTSLAQPASPYLTESPENRKVVNRLARSVPCIALLFKLQSARKVFTSFLCRFLQLLQALSIYKRRCINLLLL